MLFHLIIIELNSSNSKASDRVQSKRPTESLDFLISLIWHNGILGMADIRRTYGEYSADIWRIYDGHTANIRRMVG